MFASNDVHPENPDPGTVVKSYVWDEENRMEEAVVGREHVYFGYDVSGEERETLGRGVKTSLKVAPAFDFQEGGGIQIPPEKQVDRF